MVVLQSCVMYERKWKKDGDLEYLKEFKVVIETSSALSSQGETHVILCSTFIGFDWCLLQAGLGALGYLPFQIMSWERALRFDFLVNADSATCHPTFES